MARRGTRRPVMDARINLTPMIDVTFQLEADAFGVWTEGAGARRSELSVVVRSDRGVRAEYFLCVLWACNDVGIYRISAGAQRKGADRRDDYRL